MARKPEGELRRGWTTGACATAATKAAYTALVTGQFPDPVTIRLPRGETPAFALTRESIGDNEAWASVIKDAGDDPDVTHGAEIRSTVRWSSKVDSVSFKAGDGVGVVTKPGLPIGVGEPAINPVPREMMRAAIAEVAAEQDSSIGVEVEISIANGEELATRTWNPRLGIVGGLSVLGTTGIVVPYSCAAWIKSIHSGIDVANALGLTHVAGCTGSTSEKTVQNWYQLDDVAMLDMGDFAGGMLKYLRRKPVARLTIGGGFGKLSKLAMGHLDLHSGRSQVDFDELANIAMSRGADGELTDKIRAANTANEVLQRCTESQIPIAQCIAERARDQALATLRGAAVDVDVMIMDRSGNQVAHAKP